MWSSVSQKEDLILKVNLQALIVTKAMIRSSKFLLSSESYLFIQNGASWIYSQRAKFMGVRRHKTKTWNLTTLKCPIESSGKYMPTCTVVLRKTIISRCLAAVILAHTCWSEEKLMVSNIHLKTSHTRKVSFPHCNEFSKIQRLVLYKEYESKSHTMILKFWKTLR